MGIPESHPLAVTGAVPKHWQQKLAEQKLREQQRERLPSPPQSRVHHLEPIELPPLSPQSPPPPLPRSPTGLLTPPQPQSPSGRQPPQQQQQLIQPPSPVSRLRMQILRQTPPTSPQTPPSTPQLQSPTTASPKRRPVTGVSPGVDATDDALETVGHRSRSRVITQRPNIAVLRKAAAAAQKLARSNSAPDSEAFNTSLASATAAAARMFSVGQLAPPERPRRPVCPQPPNSRFIHSTRTRDYDFIRFVPNGDIERDLIIECQIRTVPKLLAPEPPAPSPPPPSPPPPPPAAPWPARHSLPLENVIHLMADSWWEMLWSDQLPRLPPPYEAQHQTILVTPPRQQPRPLSPRPPSPRLFCLRSVPPRPPSPRPPSPLSPSFIVQPPRPLSPRLSPARPPSPRSPSMLLSPSMLRSPSPSAVQLAVAEQLSPRWQRNVALPLNATGTAALAQSMAVVSLSGREAAERYFVGRQRPPPIRIGPVEPLPDEPMPDYDANDAADVPRERIVAHRPPPSPTRPTRLRLRNVITVEPMVTPAEAAQPPAAAGQLKRRHPQSQPSSEHRPAEADEGRYVDAGAVAVSPEFVRQALDFQRRPMAQRQPPLTDDEKLASNRNYARMMSSVHGSFGQRTEQEEEDEDQDGASSRGHQQEPDDGGPGR